ncbi:MAG: hypothetical protein A2934_02825 [Candidatus Sungbacteria bacterium RIFCSPLOWO2_01_FULL_47_10]|uniref:Uncharacterized protein n=1 Tax=Candidatus Sungbacteria bacterium RIFCSPLOWO2_01_FULL_47_10 TaxID=1802276 RepID=A0A1G2L8A5_9BACT|nr:MAG: hypothetical protein A2934_02825 [Candidatus Sungbacteria bacterium RIFCSPLOWO2_01_FULL_47_10]
MKEGEGPFFNPKAEEEKMPEERIFEEGEGVRKDEDEVEDAPADLSEREKRLWEIVTKGGGLPAEERFVKNRWLEDVRVLKGAYPEEIREILEKKMLSDADHKTLQTYFKDRLGWREHIYSQGAQWKRKKVGAAVLKEKKDLQNEGAAIEGAPEAGGHAYLEIMWDTVSEFSPKMQTLLRKNMLEKKALAPKEQSYFDGHRDAWWKMRFGYSLDQLLNNF